VEAHSENIPYQRQSPIDDQAKENNGRKEEVVGIGIPLTQELVSRTVEFDTGTDIVADTLSLKMIDMSGRNMIDLPARLIHPQSPIGLFKKEKIPFVKQTYFLDGVSTNQETGPDPGINLYRGFVVMALARIFSGE